MSWIRGLLYITSLWQGCVAFAGSLGNYCNHPPLAPPTVVAAKPSQRDGYQLDLVGVHVIFRHGARDLLSNLRCWEPWLRGGRPRSQCGRPRSQCGPRLALGLEWSGKIHNPPLVRQYSDYLPPSDHGPAAIIQGNPSCSAGQLLKEAVPQFEALAAALTKAYTGRLADKLTPEDTRFYASETDRATGSLDLLQHFLFNSSGVGSSPHVLHTRPEATDPWTLNACPTAKSNVVDAADEKPASSVPRFVEFAKAWRNATGTEFIATFKDCLILAECGGPEMLELPRALMVNRDLFDQALSVAGQLYAESYKDNVETFRLLSAPILLELLGVVQKQLQPDHGMPRLALWGTHDVVLAALLSGLGIWDGVWPSYAEPIILEIYRETATTVSEASSAPSSRNLFRWLRKGRPLKLPGCVEDLPGALCDISAFIPPEVKPFLDPGAWYNECFETPQVSQIAAKSKDVLISRDQFTWRFSSGLAVGATMIALFSFVAGVAFGSSKNFCQCRRSEVKKNGPADALLHCEVLPNVFDKY